LALLLENVRGERKKRRTIPKRVCYVLPSPDGELKIFASGVVIVFSTTGAAPACACAKVHFFFPLSSHSESPASRRNGEPNARVHIGGEVARLWVDWLDPEIEFRWRRHHWRCDKAGLLLRYPFLALLDEK
jgi:hypothetical protein